MKGVCLVFSIYFKCNVIMKFKVLFWGSCFFHFFVIFLLCCVDLLLFPFSFCCSCHWFFVWFSFLFFFWLWFNLCVGYEFCLFLNIFFCPCFQFLVNFMFSVLLVSVSCALSFSPTCRLLSSFLGRHQNTTS